MIILFTILEFAAGSLMFSYWLGLAARKDITVVGDGNPGAFNLWHSAGMGWGILGVLLDVAKGFFPLILLLCLGWVSGWGLVPAALAPILGHIFSPFLRGRGGKAIAVTFGVWCAVTLFEAALVYALILAALLGVAKLLGRGRPTSSDADGFMAVTGMTLLGGYLLLRSFAPPVLALWGGNLLALGYSNRMKVWRFCRSALRKAG